MPIGLRAGVSFCDASGHLIFLDVPHDRYFALGAEADTAFRALLGGSHGTTRDLQPLLDTGFLIDGPRMRPPRVCEAPAVPGASLLDRPLPHISHAGVALAASALLRTRLQLRWQGLGAVLDRVARARRVDQTEAPSADSLARIAAAFEKSSALTRSHDQCLVRSAAAAIRLAAAGIATDLLIGVRVRPFAAHSWLQAGELLVNDRLDNVRGYTPILVL